MTSWLRDMMRVGALATVQSRPVAHQQGFLDCEGVRVHHAVYGDGDPVLLIHGYGVTAEINWRLPGMVSALAKRYRVHVLDVRGHGSSGKPHDPAQYGVKMVADVMRLMDHLEIPQAHLVGYSMGGFILMRMMVSDPQRFLSATLGGSGGIRQGFPLWPWTERLAALLNQGMSYSEANIVAAPAALHRSLSRPEQMLIRALPDSNDPLAMAAVIESWRELEIDEEQLRLFRTPTLVVFGSLEIPQTVEYIKRLGTILPQATVHEIPGTNHFDTVISQEFQDVTKEFLDRQPNRS
ncbi:MAG: alpha/beta fold hydrolase [Pirellulaceae bacterium]